MEKLQALISASVEEIKRREAVLELPEAQELCVLDVRRIYTGQITIQVNNREAFENLIIESGAEVKISRFTNDYPYEVFIEQDGVRIFCLYKKLPDALKIAEVQNER